MSSADAATAATSQRKGKSHSPKGNGDYSPDATLNRDPDRLSVGQREPIYPTDEPVPAAHHDSISTVPDFIRYSSSNGRYACHVVFRILVLLLSAAAVALTCVSYAFSWAKVDVLVGSLFFSSATFDIHLWKLVTAQGSFIRFDNNNQWVSIGTSVCMILCLAFAVVAMALALALSIMRCVHEKRRRDDDVERERALERDRQAAAEAARQRQQRRQQQQNASPTHPVPSHDGADAAAQGKGFDGAAKPHKAATASASPPPEGSNQRYEQADDVPPVRSSGKPAAYYIQRETRRRQLDFNVGVATFVFLVCTFITGVIALIYFGIWVNSDALGDALEDNLEDGGTDLDDDDINENSSVELRLGYWIVIPAVAAALLAFVFLVIPALTGFRLCGPQRVRRGKSVSSEPDSGEHEMAPRPDRYHNASSAYPQERQNPPTGGEGGAPAPAANTGNPQAMRGIPVALPGPPVDDLEVGGDDQHAVEGKAQGYDRRPREEREATAPPPYDDIEDDGGLYQHPYLPNAGTGETADDGEAPETQAARARSAAPPATAAHNR